MKTTMQNGLYSFYTTFMGASLLTQHEGANVREACLAWKAYIVQEKPFAGLNLEEFLEGFELSIEEDIIAIGHCRNVWNFGFTATGKRSIEAHIFQTVAEEAGAEARASGRVAV
jgi:hypothetical protein